MCLLCVEIMKGNLTAAEAIRADREMVEPHTEAELAELAKYIEANRPDIKEALYDEFGSDDEGDK